jgi:diphthamide synthase (EF-2-diphthine--ammonia ligase)
MCDPVDEERTEADDIIEEVREIRRRISAQSDDDPVKLGAYLVEYQKRFADRLVDPRTWRKGKSAA